MSRRQWEKKSQQQIRQYCVIMQEREQNPLTPCIMYNSKEGGGRGGVPTSDFVIGPGMSLDITCLCSQCTVNVHTASKSGAKSCLLHHAG